MKHRRAYGFSDFVPPYKSLEQNGKDPSNMPSEKTEPTRANAHFFLDQLDTYIYMYIYTRGAVRRTPRRTPNENPPRNPRKSLGSLCARRDKEKGDLRAEICQKLSGVGMGVWLWSPQKNRTLRVITHPLFLGNLKQKITRRCPVRSIHE